ncbi:MAG: hypothetical protein V2I67_07860 [Thermoanaerobaculales bacterium]|jgi:hypothetical protein|nr:hypothetical protein [Thermoanaerobaculales bacterium]
MTEARPSLTEKTAAIAWARAWNTRNLELLRPLIHRKSYITDQRRWDPRRDLKDYLQRLQDLFDHLPSEHLGAAMELAETPSPGFIGDPPRPCVIEYRRRRPYASILFRVHAGLIRQVEIRLLPPPSECSLSGIYPGIEESLDLAEVN